MFTKHFTYFILTGCLILSVRPAGFGQTVRHTREPDIVRVEGMYSGYGKLFGSARDLSTDQLRVKENFLPGDSDILQTERLMQSQYAGIDRTDPRFKGMYQGDYKTHYYRYYRQYVGLIDQAGDRLVFIQLFHCCKKIRRCYPDWKQELVTSMREDKCSGVNWFYVNLTKEKVIVY